LESQLHKSVQAFLSGRQLLRWGVRPEIGITTKTGRVLYPLKVSDPPLRETADPLFLSPEATASRNLEILNEGFLVKFGVEIPNNTWVANGVLLFYLFIVSALLARVYVARTREAERLNRLNAEALEKAGAELARSQGFLGQLKTEEESYRERINLLHSALHKARDRLESTEHDALAEMETLEKRLKESTALREAMEQEVVGLREEVTRLTVTSQRFEKKREKQAEGLTKRLRVLYKKVQFHEKAVQGLQELEDDLQLKAEETVHAMNEDVGKVPVKRKVFLGKAALTVLESEFAYRGRIYWRRGANGKVEILAVGTKNTQPKDLAHLESLSP
jgi:predicted  nucleic acid-binding Zn-ribbon protein